MATKTHSDREFQYRRANVKQPVVMFWTRSGDEEVPAIGIDEGSRGELMPPIYDHFGANTVEELATEVYGPTKQTPRESVRQIGVLTGRVGNIDFYGNREILGFVTGVSDEFADGLIEWFGDISSLCETVRRGDWADVPRDAEVDGYEWADEAREIDNMEKRLKDAGAWQEPDDVTASDW